MKIKGLKQQQWQRLQKRHLKKWSCTASNFIALIPSCLSHQLNSKGLYQSSGKEKESCCLVFPSTTVHEFMHFHIVVVQRWQRNVQKSMVHMQSCCFANLNLLLFHSSYFRHCHHSLSSLNSHQFTRVSAITFFKFSINRPNNCIQMPPSLLLFNKWWVWWALICCKFFVDSFCCKFYMLRRCICYRSNYIQVRIF